MKIFKADLGYKQLNFGCNAEMEGYPNSVYTDKLRWYAKYCGYTEVVRKL